MYIPKLYQVKDFTEVEQFINKHSFGTIISHSNEKPLATHTPMLLRNINGQSMITGHMAKANPQWQSLDETTETALIIFQGPHTYVSSSWYERENVPTWNYQAVHIYGKAQLMTEEELTEDLTLLLEKYEKDNKQPVLWDTLSHKTKQQLNSIVGFKVEITDIQAAYKLSQNRNKRDFNNVIEKLSQGDSQAKKIADAMRKIKRDK